ncbi:hypothetical protein SAMN06265337_0128 [Hymenobacter gelipurpurascens]|uniref:Uncharacterized protein n=1 Tax=Hymenobacter gelipurpurascens TaxID=89968 RepID=A0A212T1U3_9BACT|nr:hypothetical protein [Hymenobacter gelipurpurascens]SNC59801.1 hypothetical protein SAMN06265337_0128 [Hymenobacter gelipurpurascens]
MSGIRFALYGGPADSLQHLILLVRQRPYMHWVLPTMAGRKATGKLERSLLLESTEALQLPALVAQGPCQQAYEPFPATGGGLRAAIASGRMLLTFSGAEITGTYSFIRLHATSLAWLLSPVTYLTGKQPGNVNVSGAKSGVALFRHG